MELTLLPLAILALFGGIINLPEYLGRSGWLTGFLAPLTGIEGVQAGNGSEVILQMVAGAIALLGLAIAHTRYAGGRWRAREQGLPTREYEAFFRDGWYF